MTQEHDEPIPAPEFPAGLTWLQGGPLTMAGLKGGPVLIDFWDYTCANCIRTLPYLKEWSRRYRDHKLTVIGVHAPEFSFAREYNNVLRAVREQGIEYAVLLDNDYAVWQAYANRYWPAKYLVDASGYLRYVHFGEGGYVETEQAIQALIKDTFPQALLPAVMEPVRQEDQAGAVCYRVSPELYLGYARGNYGNAQLTPDRRATYRDPGMHMDGHLYIEGDWLLTGEYLARPAGAGAMSKLVVPYMAKEVNLVVHPPSYGGDAIFSVMQDDVPLAAEDAGSDVKAGGSTSTMTVDEPRMYRVVKNREIGRHELTLATTSDGVTMYAFTFISCVIPGETASVTEG